jgi:foldase protein PrsA
MTLKAIFSKVSVFVLAAICCIGLTACDNEYGYTGGTAATVNGTAIDEDTVTKYIEDFRTTYDLTSEEDWAEWLIECSEDPESIRSQVIDYYVQQELISQAADENGIVIEDSAIDEQVDSVKSNYSDDSAWEEALEQSGLTEDEYREAIKRGLTEQAVEDKVVEIDDTDDAALLEYINVYQSMLTGSKRSSHILLEEGDDEKAQEIVDMINSGQIDFATAAEQYSIDTDTASNGGDLGWDTINSFVDEYTTALDSIDKGEITTATSDYGIHIIMCTDVLELDDDPSSLSDYPDEIVEYMRTFYESQQKSEAFEEWLDTYESEADIVINDMPSNVPYNVDLTQYESDDEEATDDETLDDESSSDSSDSSDSSSDTEVDVSATESESTEE